MTDAAIEIEQSRSASPTNPQPAKEWTTIALGTGAGSAALVGFVAFTNWAAIAPALTAVVFLALGLALVAWGVALSWVAGRPKWGVTLENILAAGVMVLALWAAILAPDRYVPESSATFWAVVAAFAGLLLLLVRNRGLGERLRLTAGYRGAAARLLIVGAVSEGIGIYLVLMGLVGEVPRWLAGMAMIFAVVRYALWWAYNARVAKGDKPAAPLAALAEAESTIAWLGHAAPAVALVLILAGLLPDLWALLGGVMLTLGGWQITWTMSAAAPNARG